MKILFPKFATLDKLDSKNFGSFSGRLWTKGSPTKQTLKIVKGGVGKVTKSNLM